MGSDLKREILALLREDEEFRYAVMGLLGIADIRASIDSLVRAIGELKDVVAKHGEEIGELRKAVEALSKSVEGLRSSVDSLRGTVEILSRSSEESRRIVEVLSEDVRKHGEAMLLMQNSLEKLTSSVTALGYRYGLFTEEAFRESVKYLVSDLLKVYQVRRWTYFDGEGVVFGHPSVIDVDVLVRDNEHVLVEYKAAIDRGDVAELYREGLLYERVNKVKPRLLIVGPAIRRRALELAEELGVEVRAPEVI
ncbi:MAG: PD-(D/E)XK nuclease family protein [Thermoproteus sp.]